MPSTPHPEAKESAEAGTLAERVARILAGEIRGRVYPVNSRLPTEQALTEQYGVSRTVIREAISQLKFEGLVATRQGSGTVVLPGNASESFRLSRADDDPGAGVIRILELRRGIEAEMAALAAERRTAAELQDIRRSWRAIVEAVKDGFDGAREDLAFHIAIARATHNMHYVELLSMLTRSLLDAIRVTRSNEARRVDMSAQVNAEHEAIFSAISARNPKAARQAAFQHMHNTEARLKQGGEDFWLGDSRATAQRLARIKLGTELQAKAPPKKRGPAAKK